MLSSSWSQSPLLKCTRAASFKFFCSTRKGEDLFPGLRLPGRFGPGANANWWYIIWWTHWLVVGQPFSFLNYPPTPRLGEVRFYEEVERLRYHCGFPSDIAIYVWGEDVVWSIQCLGKPSGNIGNNVTERIIIIPLVEEVEVQPIGAGPHSFAARFPTIANWHK